MAASRLTVLLLLLLTAQATAVSANASLQSLKVCSAPSCVFRNGTHCDRMTQDCARCVMHDPLLGSPVCAELEAGRRCIRNFTLCPATPLETTISSDAGYQPMDSVPVSTVSSSLPRASDQQVFANNVASAGIVDSGGRTSSVPTWATIVAVAAVVVVASLFFTLIRHKKQLLLDEPTTPLSPTTKGGDAPSLPHNADSPTFLGMKSQTNETKRLGHPIAPSTIHDRKQQPPSAHVTKPRSATQISDLAFSVGPDSYRHHSSTSEIAMFMDTERSLAVDYWEVDGADRDTMDLDRDTLDLDDWRDSLGVDDMVMVGDGTSARVDTADVDDDDDVDIYPDTSMTILTERERMFSPKTRRVLAPTSFMTFSVDDDEASEEESYPDTSLPETLSSTVLRSATELETDVVDPWESHRELPGGPTHALQQQQVAKWKAKYQNDQL